MSNPVFLLPLGAFFNKQYGDVVPSDEQRAELLNAIKTMHEILRFNTADSGATFHDDLMVWFRNLFFTNEAQFQDAFREFQYDLPMRARMWRLYNLCWALGHALHTEGDVLDIGCYDGKTAKVFCNYNKDRLEGRNVCLFDLFDNSPKESRKPAHGPYLAIRVEQLMSKYHGVVVKGDVKETIPAALPDKICFAHIDLNFADAEAHVFPEVYARMSRGGVVVFDDFGFKRYRESAQVHFDFLADKPEKILELPTGQGLFFKV